MRSVHGNSLSAAVRTASGRFRFAPSRQQAALRIHHRAQHPRANRNLPQECLGIGQHTARRWNRRARWRIAAALLPRWSPGRADCSRARAGSKAGPPPRKEPPDRPAALRAFQPDGSPRPNRSRTAPASAATARAADPAAEPARTPPRAPSPQAAWRATRSAVGARHRRIANPAQPPVGRQAVLRPAVVAKHPRQPQQRACPHRRGRRSACTRYQAAARSGCGAGTPWPRLPQKSPPALRVKPRSPADTAGARLATRISSRT